MARIKVFQGLVTGHPAAIQATALYLVGEQPRNVHALERVQLPNYTTVWAAVIPSTIGTIYGVMRQAVPLWTPWQIIPDLIANPGGAAVGLALQLGLTLGQWGGIELAREDRRWWAVYAAALGASVVLNLLGYWEPLVMTAGLPWLLAVAAVVAGDVLPEWLLKR